MPFSYVEMMNSFGLEEYARLPQFEAVPPTPIGPALADATVGLFTTVGALLPSHRPFKPQNDLTFRLLPRETPVAELDFEHPSPIRSHALEDLNVAYPRDRLVELEEEGVIGELAPQAVSMLGSITTYTQLAEQTVPGIAHSFREQGVDLVLLVPFCPACHRATAIVARGLEKQGLPTIMLTVLREMAEAFRPARPVFLDFPLGATVGKPNDPELQREILRQTLTAGAAMAEPWHVHDLPFQWSEDGNRDWEDDVRGLYAGKGREIHRARVEEHIEDGETLSGREREFEIGCAC
ncbi:MAG TPA: glycine/sarcosine/betaine reductase selenoprotein B family protein [Solirubrobacterales bacterium]|jgi:glycine/betaine/sarcosine/D-proline reductase family selenoprotein B